MAAAAPVVMSFLPSIGAAGAGTAAAAGAASAPAWLGALTQGLSIGSAALTGMQAIQGVQQQQAAAKQAGKQAEYLQQQAAAERAAAERNAALVQRQREMEKRQERRDYQQELARARVGGVSSESLLASADRFSLSSSQKDWLTGQQAEGILASGAQRASGYASDAAQAKSKSKYGAMDALPTLLQGGFGAFNSYVSTRNSMHTVMDL